MEWSVRGRVHQVSELTGGVPVGHAPARPKQRHVRDERKES